MDSVRPVQHWSDADFAVDCRGNGLDKNTGFSSVFRLRRFLWNDSAWKGIYHLGGYVKATKMTIASRHGTKTDGSHPDAEVRKWERTLHSRRANPPGSADSTSGSQDVFPQSCRGKMGEEPGGRVRGSFERASPEQQTQNAREPHRLVHRRVREDL